MRQRLTAWLAFVMSLAGETASEIGWWLDVLEGYGERLARSHGLTDETLARRVGQTNAVLAVVTIGITLLISILIYGQIDNSLPEPNNSELANASSNVTSTYSDTMNLAPVIMIVLIAGVVLSVVQRFR